MVNLKEIRSKDKECLFEVRRIIEENDKQHFEFYKTVFSDLNNVCLKNFNYLLVELRNISSTLNVYNVTNSVMTKAERNEAFSNYKKGGKGFFEAIENIDRVTVPESIENSCDIYDSSTLSRIINDYCIRLFKASKEGNMLKAFYDTLQALSTSSYNGGYQEFINDATRYYISHYKPEFQNYLENNFIPKLYCPILPNLIEDIKITLNNIKIFSDSKFEECNILKQSNLNSLYHEIIVNAASSINIEKSIGEINDHYIPPTEINTNHNPEDSFYEFSLTHLAVFGALLLGVTGCAVYAYTHSMLPVFVESSKTA